MSSTDSDNTGKYRKRIEDESGGLAKEDVRRSPYAGGLSFEKIGDTLDAGPMVVPSVSDDLLPLDEAVDGTLADLGIGLLLAEQRGSRARELLARAQSLISSGQYLPALLVVEEAVAADGSCDEALVSKGRCLTLLGHHDAALRVLSYARGSVSDPQLRIYILKLEADCVRAGTRALENQLIELAAKRQLSEALTLVGQGLAKQPANMVFLYHKANLQWLSGDLPGATDTMEEARRLAGGDNIDLITGLERKMEFGPHHFTVEAARLALRQSDAATALQRLDTCAAALQGNEHYEALRAYAESKRRTLGQLLGRKAQPPFDALRQRTLRWILSEELREADEALRAGDNLRARTAFEKAEALEPDCAAVCYKHARAIFLACRHTIETQSSSAIWSTAQDLKEAEQLASRAALDPGFQELAKALGKGIASLRLKLGG